jgi:hypothetical protein
MRLTNLAALSARIHAVWLHELPELVTNTSMKRDIQRGRKKSCNVATPKYPIHKFEVGQKVTVTHSVYSGISVGEVGIVDCRPKQGYGVAFTKHWPVTVINEKPVFGRRVLFFEQSELK